MDDQTAARTTAAIADLFPNTKTNPALCGAITQELLRGTYDQDRVVAWANFRRSETHLFELTELRKFFFNDQPKNQRPLDGATLAMRRQRAEIEANYESGKAEREQQKYFFNNCTPEDEIQLRAEYLDTLEPEPRALCEGRPSSSKFIRDGIWAMVKQRAGKMQKA